MEHRVKSIKMVARYGEFTQEYAHAEAGDYIELTNNDFLSVSPHPLGMIGTKETDSGCEVYINKQLHHLAQSSTILPFFEDTIEVVGNSLHRVIVKRETEFRKKIYTHSGSLSKIVPHVNGGIIIIDNTASTISLLEMTKPSLKNRFGLKPNRILYLGNWDNYHPYPSGVIISLNGRFFKGLKSKPWIIYEDWKPSYRWWPFEDDIAILIDDSLIERKTNKVLWSNASLGEVYSCNGKLVQYHNGLFTFFHYDQNGHRTLEVCDIPCDEIVSEHWLGLIFRRNTTYYLFVVK